MTLRRFLAWSLYALAVALTFEGVARLALSSPRMREGLFTNDDASWRLQWAARQAEQKGLNYVLDDWSPSRGWTLKPNLRDVPFRGKVVNSNSKGIRGVAEFAYEKPPGVTRIVVLGDSFTFGEEVGDDDTYSHHLQNLIPNSEVLNLGIHGYGHDQMLLYLQEEGLKYRPDIVLLGFMPDDMERNVLSFRDYAKPHFAVKDGRMELTTGPIPRPEETLAAEKWRSRFLDLLTMARSRYEWRSGRTSATTKELTAAILDAMKAASETAGARAVFAYLPVYGEIPRTDEGMTARERAFFSYCKDRGIASLYIQPAFRAKARRGVKFKTTGHWGPLEHETAAEGLKDELVAKGLLRGPAPAIASGSSASSSQ
ncbi:MAG: SGNH/GDSL hydrolase family protein [Vicinamibacteria bacterium]|nr:SGNH/GDSL hydrolase family protein [Vicinamibacteria bacterium]